MCKFWAAVYQFHPQMSDSNQVDLDGDLKCPRSVDCDMIIIPVWKMLGWCCPGLEYLQKLVNKRALVALHCV